MGRGVLLLVCLCGCAGAGSDAGDDGPGGGNHDVVDDNPFLEHPVLGAANAVAAGAPGFSGQQRFLWDTWGTEVGGSLPPVDFLLALLASDPATYGPQFSNFGFLVDPDDDLPVGLKRGRVDATRASFTCAACHTAELPDGRLWFGAPNSRLRSDALQLTVDAAWVAAGNASAFDSYEHDTMAAHGTGRTGAESDSTGFAIPIDFPAKWDLGLRDNLNSTGSGGDLRTESYLSMFASGAGRDGVPFPASSQTGPFLEFFGALQPPVNPTPAASALVEAGAAVFAAAGCGGCHDMERPWLSPVVSVDAVERLPGDDPDFPRGAIATDTARYELLAPDSDGGGGSFDEGYQEFITFIFDQRLSLVITDGYRASDLRGLWVSAPYLHNGSVPTLEDLLRPAAERPVTWMHEGFEVDTSVVANGNFGHEFGTTLSAGDKAALVAYLLTL